MFLFLILTVSVSVSFSANKPETDVSSIPHSPALPTGSFLMGAGIAHDVTFEAWNAEEERFLFQRRGKRFAFKNADFLHWGHPADFSATESCLVLTDGSIFAGIPIQTQDDTQNPTIEWENPIFGTLTFTLAESVAMLFNTLMPQEREMILTELNGLKHDTDTLIFRTGECLSGEFLRLDNDMVHFRTRSLSTNDDASFLPVARTLEVSVSQTAAILFSTELSADSVSTPAKKYFWIGLIDGSLFRLATDAQRPALTAIPPETIVYVESPQQSQRFFDTSITAVADAIPEIQWLDTLKPTEITPLGSLWRANTRTDGTRLRANGKIFRHGISLRTEDNSTLAWHLDKKYTSLGLRLAKTENYDENEAEKTINVRISANGTPINETTLIPEKEESMILVPLDGASELRLDVQVSTPKGEKTAVEIQCLDAFLVP